MHVPLYEVCMYVGEEFSWGVFSLFCEFHAIKGTSNQHDSLNHKLAWSSNASFDLFEAQSSGTPSAFAHDSAPFLKDVLVKRGR